MNTAPESTAAVVSPSQGDAGARASQLDHAAGGVELTAVGVIGALKRCGITHLVWLPDSEAGFLYQALSADPDIRLVPVCREGEAMAVALGLTVAGCRPGIVIQNTGFLESGDSVRGAMLDTGFPFFLIIGYRGWKAGEPMSDSAGVFTEPVLKAWGIPYSLVEDDRDLPRIERAYQEAHERRGPVAVLIGREYR
ncbi:MAG TPA: thiamine pyrophosphate-binding protein [Chloroflexota bacterium]|jgi:sulfopyruvate decarboxylase TPP-binding subunit|nr:thiamine pyrophosphate-binding protein [Chloroflexota bacterium]